jgi:hypothetical protein
MARRIDWDASNRQAKLHKWIRDNGNYSWLEDLPPQESHEVDAWAKRQVRKSVSRVRRQIEEDKKVQLSTSAQINHHLDIISTALTEHNELIARKSGESLLNLMLNLNLTSVDSQTRSQIIETIGLLIIATSD